MYRTIRLRLLPTQEEHDLLLESASIYTASFNEVCRYGWKRRERNGVALHHATYRSVRAQWPQLPSNLHVQARVQATEAIKSAMAGERKGGRASMPQASSPMLRLLDNTCRIFWTDRSISLATTRKYHRPRIALSLPPHLEPPATARFKGGNLVYRDGQWWLHAFIELPTPEALATGGVIGVDMGLVRPAVTSNHQFLGKRYWRELEAKAFRLRRKLQKSNTKSARRHLRKIGRKRERRRRDHDHVISKRIVQATPKHGVIAVENLTDVRKRIKTRRGPQARRIHTWSFAQLRRFIEYKAEERGLTVVGVDPRHTSQTCSACGHQARNNRRSQGDFWCRSCGFRLNADLNGARNIAAKYHAGEGTSLPGG